MVYLLSMAPAGTTDPSRPREAPNLPDSTRLAGPSEGATRIVCPALAERPSLLASVIVPTVGRRDLVARLLVALARQTLPLERFEVIVVVDGGTEGTEGIDEMIEGLRDRLRITCLVQPRGGRASACNTGLRRAGGHVVVFLDDDMEPIPGWLQAHLDAHGGTLGRCVMGAAPITVDAESRPFEVWMSRNFDDHNAKLARPGHAFVLRDFYTGNTSMVRGLLLEVGGFDEDFRVYGHEDLELLVRLRRRGTELRFEPAAVARQEYHKVFPTFARDTQQAGATAVLLARKHPEIAPEVVLYRGGGRVWRTVSACLLFATRHWSGVPRLVVALESLLARAAPNRLSRFYACAADYFFWVGVQQADPRGRRVFG
jgi:glycosyltransferase involved in cell wall biosynthesis